MKKIIYTRPEDDLLAIVVPAPKSSLEFTLGTLTEEQYEKHVWKMSIPENAINPRYIKDEDIPFLHLEFKDAWCDITPLSKIDICCKKSRDIQLGILRKNRQEEFNKLGVPNKFHKNIEDAILDPQTRAELERLREITEPLKTLNVDGKFNDETLLNEIKKLGVL